MDPEKLFALFVSTMIALIVAVTIPSQEKVAYDALTPAINEIYEQAQSQINDSQLESSMGLAKLSWNLLGFGIWLLEVLAPFAIILSFLAKAGLFDGFDFSF
ncbi:hypothetical protein [Thermococcus barophilus]|uniref:Uncharacterized protein n=1 Tax=Thermococcus barophilus (strain DSM 11836 / MP) TaxID=391623 RepID=F0LKJ8_THEBM|nr:hypothetical protein [Thermococcus barophilus]ADT84832.1 hypothetical protein TERMP_01857 [Thermococcus barophilus MP]